MTRAEAIKQIEAFRTCMIVDGAEPYVVEALNMAVEALEQEQKTGHWIIKDGKEQGYDIGGVKSWYIQIMCNECGFVKTAIEGHTGQYHYCPNCGAKMQEVKDDKRRSKSKMDMLSDVRQKEV